MPDNSIKLLEQGRAKAAYDFASLGKAIKRTLKTPKDEDTKEAKEYKSYCKKIPMMIKTNGLGSAMAFVKSKSSKDAYDLIYKQVEKWLKSSIVTADIFKASDKKDMELVQVIISEPSATYRLLTVEVLALFSWLKRFAEGLIQGEAEGDDL